MDQQNPTNSASAPRPEKLTYRDQRYFELYANNVNFETSVWDMKMLFALFEQDKDMPPFKQLCGIRVPWAQAKLMAYYLFLNIAFHEVAQGEIRVPETMLPKPIEGMLNDLPADEKAAKIVDRIQKMRELLGL